MAHQSRARLILLALGSLGVAACGGVPRGENMPWGYQPLALAGSRPVLAPLAPLPGPLAPTPDPGPATLGPSPRPLPFLSALDRAARHQERGAAELRRGNTDAAELEFHRALGVLLDPGADAVQRASYRMSRPPLQPELPRWQDQPPQAAPEEGDDPPVDEGDPLPPGPALITPEDVKAIEGQPPGAVAAPEVDTRVFDVPIVLNERVRTFIHYFSNRKFDLISRAFERASRYLPMMREIFREKGLPRDLLNLAFIESAFNPRARSRAGATGIWQFTQGTGRRFGMPSGFWVDHRRDPERSTRAAAEYLKTLYGMFESWPLALAAYNAGEGKVQKAIARQKTTDFWRLPLPKETKLFVPAFMAMTVIAKDPARYGFSPLPEQVPAVETLPLEESVDLRVLARAAHTTPAVIRELNPTLLRGATPPGPFSLRLPAGSGEGFLDRLAQLPRPKRTPWVHQRVRKGDTWASLARRHQVSANALLELNGRSAMGPLKVGSTILVPGRGVARAEASAAPASGGQAPAATPPASPRRYTVKRGDTLAKIAKAHRIRLEDLMGWNELNARQVLKPGQILVVHTRQDAAGGSAPGASTGPKPGISSAARAAAPTGKGAGKARHVRYTVKPGDTLWDIAQAHGVRPEELRRWNGLRGRRHLQPGQELQIILPEAS